MWLVLCDRFGLGFIVRLSASNEEGRTGELRCSRRRRRFISARGRVCVLGVPRGWLRRHHLVFRGDGGAGQP